MFLNVMGWGGVKKNNYFGIQFVKYFYTFFLILRYPCLNQFFTIGALNTAETWSYNDPTARLIILRLIHLPVILFPQNID